MIGGGCDDDELVSVLVSVFRKSMFFGMECRKEGFFRKAKLEKYIFFRLNKAENRVFWKVKLEKRLID